MAVRSSTYDVFLSFRGSDTRCGFSGNLYKALCDKGIHTFFDDVELQRGDQITPSLVKAIQESRIAIPVFSINYASSSFCLDELVIIIECVKAKDRLVLPIFYDVDPSHVRHQTGSYGQALAKHEDRFANMKENLKDNMERLHKWKMALNQAANLSGFNFKFGIEYEHEFIGKIVKEVSYNINSVPLHVADYPVGLESRVLQVKSLLEFGTEDGVHMVGIYGIGGVGKTTLARAVYNVINKQFDGSFFLHSVREKSLKHGLEHLQEKLLSKIVGLNNKLGDVAEGISIIKQRLHRKKILLILDDVDNLKQLQVMVGGSHCLGPGSRVIITTRDKHLLSSYEVEKTYQVYELSKGDALKLIRWNAFKNNKVDPSYNDILNCVVTYASGLPLALEVIGSNLFGKSIEEWKSALYRYKRIPNKEIQKILQVSFDALEEDEQRVFLDIACCFKGWELEEVEEILSAHYGNCMKYDVGVLFDKCLIKRGLHHRVTLHDLIEDMGKEIVRQESPKDPGKRSRLWFHKDIVQVLEDNRGTSDIEIIYLDFPLFEEVEWDGEAFKKMENLKTLIIRNSRFSRSPKYLPNSLRVLEWWRYPSNDLPSDFHPKKLAICKLPRNCIVPVKLVGLLKKFVNLRVLDLDNCVYLTHIPNVSALVNLEKFSFHNCRNLITIHDSVGFLYKLKILNASKCFKLRSFPPIKLTSLEKLDLSMCSQLENFPEILGKMENISELDLHATSIKELPSSFINLSRLRRLYLRSGGMFRLPSCITMMPELAGIRSEFGGLLLPKQDEDVEKVTSMLSSNVECLHLESYYLSDGFFQMGLLWFANLKELIIRNDSFTILPECIKDYRFLWKLDLDNCNSLQEIRGIPPNLKYFSAMDCRSFTSLCTRMLLTQELHETGETNFCLPGARIPEWFEHRGRGRSISFWFRNKFPAIALCLVRPMNVYDERANVIINSSKGYSIDLPLDYRHISTKMDHTYLFGPQKVIISYGSPDEALLKNKWNHAEVTYHDVDLVPLFKEIGIHVFKRESSMEDVLFTDPYKRELNEDLNNSQSQSHPMLKRNRFMDMEVFETQVVRQKQRMG